jgi:hypothetical protein
MEGQLPTLEQRRNDVVPLEAGFVCQRVECHRRESSEGVLTIQNNCVGAFEA